MGGSVGAVTVPVCALVIRLALPRCSAVEGVPGTDDFAFLLALVTPSAPTGPKTELVDFLFLLVDLRLLFLTFLVFEPLDAVSSDRDTETSTRFRGVGTSLEASLLDIEHS